VLVHDRDVPLAELAAHKAALVADGSRVRLEQRTKNLKALLERAAADGYTSFATGRRRPRMPRRNAAFTLMRSDRRMDAVDRRRIRSLRLSTGVLGAAGLAIAGAAVAAVSRWPVRRASRGGGSASRSARTPSMRTGCGGAGWPASPWSSSCSATPWRPDSAHRGAGHLGGRLAKGLARRLRRPVRLRTAAIVGSESTDLDAQLAALETDYLPHVAVVVVGGTT
jgi:hypothetical protein